MNYGIERAPSGREFAKEAGNALAQGEKARELPMALNHLQSSVDTLGQLVEAIDSRLTGIVARTEGPTNPTTGPAPRQVMNTGIGSQLDAMSDSTTLAASRLRSLLDRLEF